jgi:hypothetical protein
MTESELRQYLEDNGYPRHVVTGGRAGLVRGWKRFVEQVEDGYSFTLDDYRNDLDGRAILQLAGVEDEEVRALDARLRKLLVATDVRVWESAPGDPFWDFGYPRNAGEGLREDLRNEGLLPSPS